MAPSSSSFDEGVGKEAEQTGAGSIREVSGRLLLWAKREGGSLAQVEYVSEFAKQRVEQRLRDGMEAAGVAINEIFLPTRRPATEIVEYLLAELVKVSSGVVLVTGFATAFESQVPIEDSLRIVNFSREALVAFPLRQVWWMTPVVVQKSLYAMPDLHGWFSPKLRLSELVEEGSSAGEQTNLLEMKSAGSNSSAVSLDDARQRSQRLLAQFASAKRAGADDMALLTTYLLPALEALADVGAQKELWDLTLQFEGLLGSLKLSKSPEVATGLNRLAMLYLEQGRYSEAEPLFVRSLQVRTLDDHCIEIASSLDNLAELYWCQGRYDEAEPMFVEALEIRKVELGDRHPSTADSLNNLAVLYESQGRYDEAEPLSVKALEIRKAELGNGNPDTAFSLNNLAALYRSQGRYDEAEPLYVEALEIKRSELGDCHPSTVTSINNLAVLYKSQGRYDEAELLFVKSLKISKAELGEHHPFTAFSLVNLANLYHNTQRHQQALSHIQQAAEIYLSVIGLDHPATIVAVNWRESIRQALNESPSTKSI